MLLKKITASNIRAIKSRRYWPAFLILWNFSNTLTRLYNSFKSLHNWLECSKLLSTLLF